MTTGGQGFLCLPTSFFHIKHAPRQMGARWILAAQAPPGKPSPCPPWKARMRCFRRRLSRRWWPLTTITVLGAALTPERKHVVTFFHPQDCLGSADISLLGGRALRHRRDLPTGGV